MVFNWSQLSKCGLDINTFSSLGHIWCQTSRHWPMSGEKPGVWLALSVSPCTAITTCPQAAPPSSSRLQLEFGHELLEESAFAATHPDCPISVGEDLALGWPGQWKDLQAVSNVVQTISCCWVLVSTLWHTTFQSPANNVRAMTAPFRGSTSCCPLFTKGSSQPSAKGWSPTFSLPRKVSGPVGSRGWWWLYYLLWLPQSTSRQELELP